MAAQPAKKAGSFVTKKGPLGLPVYAWLLILGAGVVGGLYLRKKLAGSSTTSGATTSSPVNTSGIDPATGIPYSQELAAAQGAAAGNTGTGTTAAASSGLSPDLENALASSLNANSGTVVSLASTVGGLGQNLTDLATTEVNAGVTAQNNAFNFAQGAFGSATDFASNALSAVTSLSSDLHQSVSPTQPTPVSVTVNIPPSEQPPTPTPAPVAPAAPAPTPHQTIASAAASSSGAGAVAAGTAKVNYQARARALK